MSVVCKQWLETFAAEVRKQKGTEVFNGFMWHRFSFGIERSIEGDAARRKYQEQARDTYVIFDEDSDFCLACEPSVYLDLADFMTDLYVAHHSMNWTMVFTHEQRGYRAVFCQQANR